MWLKWLLLRFTDNIGWTVWHPIMWGRRKRLKMRSCQQPANPPFCCHCWEKGKQRTRCHQMARWHLLCFCSQHAWTSCSSQWSTFPHRLGWDFFLLPFHRVTSSCYVTEQTETMSAPLLNSPDHSVTEPAMFSTLQCPSRDHPPCPQLWRTSPHPFFFLRSFVKTRSCHATQPGLKLLIHPFTRQV